jgi:hypothetical protein
MNMDFARDQPHIFLAAQLGFLKGYDYALLGRCSQAGGYIVTTETYRRENL